MPDHEIAVFGNAIGFEMITVDNTVKSLTPSKYKNTNAANTTAGLYTARSAFISLEGAAGTNDIRYTVDGTTPVAGSTGHVLQAGKTLVIRGIGNIALFQATRVGASSGVIAVTYFL